MKLYNLSKFKKSKLMKGSIGTVVIAATFLLSGCEKIPEYYIVTENQQNYICTRTEPFVNYDEYDYISITDEKVIGSICSSRSSFDYARTNHRVGTKFLSELQVIPLEYAFEQENIDKNIIKDKKTLENLSESNSLSDIVSNHFVRQVYELNKHFIHISDSKLQLFQSGDKVYVGYDVSPDRDFNKNRYIYSIADMDVIHFNQGEEVTNINAGIYLTEENISNGYVTYDEAINMVNYYLYYHMNKVKTKQ